MRELLTIPTRLGPLAVTRHGSPRPPLVLWHSLFVDGRSWDAVLPVLTERRSVFVIDGPCHGQSPGPDRRFGFDECVDAAVDVLDHLGLGAVDWIGNAWGGHVGVSVAARHADRIESLVAITSPIDAFRGATRARFGFLIALYRMLGWRRWLLDLLVDALVAPSVGAARPEVARYVTEAVTAPGKRPMYLAMRSLMLGRPSQLPLLPSITAPTLFVATSDDPMWTPEVARREAAGLPRGTVALLEHGRHLAPVETPEALGAILAPWLDRDAARLRSAPRAPAETAVRS